MYRKYNINSIKLISLIIGSSLLLNACTAAVETPIATTEVESITAAESTTDVKDTTAAKTSSETDNPDTGDTTESKNTMENTEKSNDLKWWQKTNVCEIYIRSFNDTDGDGYGDINGVTEKLDYLKTLGVGAIWLTPCYKSPQADNGYDVADYYEIDETFGTMDDMDRLIAEAQKRNISIVMDLVFNHTSDQNDWFLESKSSKDNPKSDWYIWMDARPDGGPPTNWRSIFGGSAWTWSEEREQYYLHTFLKEQPDLNWANPEVRKALFDVANFWVAKGVGGFRMDAVTYIKKPAFTDGNPDASDGMVAIHNMTANTDGILDYLHEFKDNVQKGTDIFTVGEANGVKPENLPDWVGDKGVFDMVFEFSHINIDLNSETNWADTRDWTLKDLKKCISDSQQNTKDNGWYPIFFENHDQPRCVDHFFPDVKDKLMSSKIIGTLMYTLRGTPFLYQGQELGLTNVTWDNIDDYNDISTKNHYQFMIDEGYNKDVAMNAVRHFTRDSARTPMQWSTADNAGFTTGNPWLPVSNDYKVKNVETEESDENSTLSWYRKMSEIRSAHSELTDGDYTEVLGDDAHIYAFTRKNSEYEAIILTNFTEDNQNYDASLVKDADLIISTCGSDSDPGTLKPLESVVFERKL